MRVLVSTVLAQAAPWTRLVTAVTAGSAALRSPHDRGFSHKALVDQFPEELTGIGTARRPAFPQIRSIGIQDGAPQPLCRRTIGRLPQLAADGLGVDAKMGSNRVVRPPAGAERMHRCMPLMLAQLLCQGQLIFGSCTLVILLAKSGGRPKHSDKRSNPCFRKGCSRQPRSEPHTIECCTHEDVLLVGFCQPSIA